MEAIQIVFAVTCEQIHLMMFLCHLDTWSQFQEQHEVKFTRNSWADINFVHSKIFLVCLFLDGLVRRASGYIIRIDMYIIIIIIIGVLIGLSKFLHLEFSWGLKDCP